MKNLENSISVNQNLEVNRRKIVRTSLLIILLLVASNLFAQTQELRFNTIEDHGYSQGIGYEYLLGNNVRLRDCPSKQCTAITTVKIGTQLKLIKSSGAPEVINGVTSSWYKVKLGPDTGWLWGGMIAKTVFKSQQDPNLKFAFGLDRFNEKDFSDQYQIRAYKNGKQLDKITVKSNTVRALIAEKIKRENANDIISLQTSKTGDFGNNNKEIYIVWEGNQFKKVSRLSDATIKIKDDELENEAECELPNPETYK